MLGFNNFMKQDTKKQLDKLQRQERLRNIIPLLCVSIVLIILISGFLIYRYAPGKTVQVSGVVTGLHGIPVPKRGEIIFLVVELDSGKSVEVKKPNGILFKKNARAQLIEIRTSMFGNVRYAFKSYEKDN